MKTLKQWQRLSAGKNNLHQTLFVMALPVIQNEANVDIKIIQEAMGHETQLQTQTYLDDIEDSIITQAINSALI